MKILIIEDDAVKCNNISTFLVSLIPNAQIVEVLSLRDGIEALSKSLYDLLLLDMTLPTFTITSTEDGGRPQSFGGMEILRRIARKNLQLKSVVITAYDKFGDGPNVKTLKEIDDDLVAEYGEFYLGTVHYSSSQDLWIKQLHELLIAHFEVFYGQHPDS